MFVSESLFQTILREETDRLLETLRLFGNKTNKPGYPSTYDINCGLCEMWAENVKARLEACDDFHSAFPTWDDDVKHCMLRYRGKWYDAECLDGVENQFDIPAYKNRKKTRLEVLIERGIVPAEGVKR